MKTDKINYLQFCHMPHWNWVVCLCFLFIIFPNYSQNQQKKIVTESDYHLWGTLQMDKLSDKGNWVSFVMNYDESPDTLYVKKTSGSKTYSIANARGGKFLNEKKFTCLDDTKTLHLLDLKSGVIREYEHIESYYFSENKKYL